MVQHHILIYETEKEKNLMPVEVLMVYQRLFSIHTCIILIRTVRMYDGCGVVKCV